MSAQERKRQPNYSSAHAKGFPSVMATQEDLSRNIIQDEEEFLDDVQEYMRQRGYALLRLVLLPLYSRF